MGGKQHSCKPYRGTANPLCEEEECIEEGGEEEEECKVAEKEAWGW